MGGPEDGWGGPEAVEWCGWPCVGLWCDVGNRASCSHECSGRWEGWVGPEAVACAGGHVSRFCHAFALALKCDGAQLCSDLGQGMCYLGLHLMSSVRAAALDASCL